MHLLAPRRHQRRGQVFCCGHEERAGPHGGITHTNFEQRTAFGHGQRLHYRRQGALHQLDAERPGRIMGPAAAPIQARLYHPGTGRLHRHAWIKELVYGVPDVVLRRCSRQALRRMPRRCVCSAPDLVCSRLARISGAQPSTDAGRSQPRPPRSRRAEVDSRSNRIPSRASYSAPSCCTGPSRLRLA